ncbi:thioredoxin domain-containing protein [Frigoribacterium sp. 2-23]|uniref:thioredoxin domain-containing protein n=1 Tax=Frigoribacterium sp. 2-23 TaxID=3415006 RepID=UPI003C6FDC3D
MKLELYTSAFCGPCHAARGVVTEAARLVPALGVHEADVVAEAGRAESRGISSTPTIVVLSAAGDEVFRADGVPRLDQLLGALALAV